MLRLRVVTALVLVGLLVPAIFFLDDKSWGFLTAVITGLAGWEFARLARFCRKGQVAFGILVASLSVLMALTLSNLGIARWVLLLSPFSVAFWVGIAPFWLRYRWSPSSHLLLALVGLVLLLPTWASLSAIRAHGPWSLLAVLGAVALADIAAYFSGRRFGKRKLAPSISPGKTWEGAWGAMAAVTAYGLCLAFANGISSLLAVALLLALPLLTLLSIAGDLFESLLKRQSGFKDSSNLLPGHGGVLDRIDSYTSTLPILALILHLS
jgi:phosphatidate cytidylyltransferase